VSGGKVIPDFRVVAGAGLLALFLAIGWKRADRE
jgi:hypothetical protein